MNIKRPELLSPAGDFEKLVSAVRFGADAVYLAGKSFGMRAASNNFSNEELKEAVEYTHARNVKLYVTVNIMPRDREYEELREYLIYLNEIKVDAIIVSDLGVMALAKEVAPDVDIHISTQASCVSAHTCKVWHSLGATRVVLARELPLEDIITIRANIPEELELEAFVHGSMCIAYSGRCLLSQYFVGRDANHGACAQSCRWVFNCKHEGGCEDCDGKENGISNAECGNDRAQCGEGIIEVAEEKRPDMALPIVQSEGDTFVMSSRDMCMIEHVPDLIKAGISSFKLEGRVRSAYYTAVVTNTYRMAIDKFFDCFDAYEYDPAWMKELCSVSHRQYDTGFFYTPPHENANIVDDMGYIREKAYLAVAVKSSKAGERAYFRQRNKLCAGGEVELLTPGKTGQYFKVGEMFDDKDNGIESAPHPNMIYSFVSPIDVNEGDILRSY